MLPVTGRQPLPVSIGLRWPSRSRRPIPSADEFKVSHTAITIHPPSRCEGYRCPWHNPSDHGMVGWPRDILTDRHSKAYREGLAKQTRHARIGATRRALATTGAMMAWMIRLFGGGGGV
jgi:hypothetical protein